MTTTPEDDRLDAALARALGPEADDTAPLSRAVLSRLAEPPRSRGGALADVLADPRPLAGAMLGALLLAGALGYAMVPADLADTAALVLILGPGF